MSTPDDLAARVEAEEFAGGSMSVPMPTQQIKDGKVIVVAKHNGNWQADCTQCGAGCGAAGVAEPQGEIDTEALDAEHRMLEDFTNEHRDCAVPNFGVVLPSPAAMPRTARGKTAWIVRGSNGSDIRVLAERHTTYARPDGTELRFYDGDGDDQHRVASVRAGSWHWVVEASALNSEAGEQ